MREHIQEVPIDLSLEQIYAGYSTEVYIIIPFYV